MALKQDSNLTGLRYAEEATLKTLPGSPIWYGMEPNSYSDFGGQLKTVARNPINPSRQRKKGSITDLDASGGFNQDLTLSNLNRLFQGFFFADLREKPTNLPMNGTQVVCTSVTTADDKYNFGADPGAFIVGHLFFASGFALAANNGLKLVSATDADDVTVASGLADETPPTTAKLSVVGFQLGSGTTALALNGDLVRLTDSATNLTTLGLIAGEWIYIGGDGAGLSFPTAVNTGWARISAIAAGYLEFDKISWTPAVETAVAKTIQIFFGNVLKNENTPSLIKRRTYNIERTLGNDDVGEMSEYLVGAVANELSVKVPQADKVTVDLKYVALDNEQRSGTVGVKAGARPAIVSEESFNTSSDISRINLSLANALDATVTPLFAYATELTLDVKNGVTPNKALGVLGGFDTSAGTFEVGGKITVYFADVAAVQAVRNNSDVTLDFIFQKPNSAMLFDIPLIGLGDGRLAVEQDKAITLPLDVSAAENIHGYTFMYINFPYLPTIASA